MLQIAKAFKKYRIISGICLAIVLVISVALYLSRSNIEVLNPKGPIAAQERSLIFFGLALSLIIVIPVYALTIVFAYKYRESNKKAKRSENLDHNLAAELTWWIIPTILIVILSVITWRSSHKLDPFKALVAVKKPLTIQVIALDWKWLFIYPTQRIATVNYAVIPINTPINFQLTSDAPMNSFWIPQLGSQIYAMPGMETQLHLMANSTGTYRGLSANISGQGFADMNFNTKATDQIDFINWVNQVSSSDNQLNLTSYNNLARPSTINSPTYYQVADNSLFNYEVMKYMNPAYNSGKGN